MVLHWGMSEMTRRGRGPGKGAGRAAVRRGGASSAVRVCGAAAAGLALAGGVAVAGAGAASAAPPGLTPIPGGAHELQVHGITSIDDVLHTGKDLILGGGDVRATTVDGVTYHYYRVVAGVRQAMVRSPEVCLPTIPCHAVLYDDLSPVY